MSESGVDTTQAAAEQPSSRSAGATARREPGTRQIAIVVAILGGGVLFTAMTSDVTKVSEQGCSLLWTDNRFWLTRPATGPVGN